MSTVSPQQSGSSDGSGGSGGSGGLGGFGGPVGLTKQVVSTIQERDVTFMAASISYYAFVSLIPLLVLATVVALAIGGDPLQQQIIEFAQANLPEAAQDLVLGALGPETAAARGGLGVVSLALTLWGALKIFRGVDVAFSRVYGSDPGGILEQVKDGVTVLGAIGLGIVGISVVTAVIALVDLPFAGLLSPLILLLTLTVAFFPFYYVLPDSGLSPREALPGTLFAAIGWTVLGTVFGVYAGSSAGGENAAAAAVGAILILLTWFYFSGILLLTGAVINAVLGGYVSGDGGTDQQVQHGPARRVGTGQMSDETQEGSAAAAAGAGPDEDRGRRDVEPHGAADINELEERIAELQADLAAFEENVDERTVQKPELERELKKYVRSKVRRSKARGWGPYLVLLYGVVLTLGAFSEFSGWVAFSAMLVIFLSTLGLYVLFVMFGTVLNVTGAPAKAVRAVRNRRD
ncbi:YhjD/YihY/BrkB family envelope integrity protein [Halobium salinum]|uniref:YhjD/YihY/BrkB family envelope integrity protein n=1 Tax=Halobium salinum TaxID=1364940 RepID=A0ABD5P8E0_9EURY|nr:YhjD/YihY/BrkB family envelope integrity protein [Halobium salinum]